METVVDVAGRTVSFPCRYDTGTLVCWGRGAEPSLFGCENAVIDTSRVGVTYSTSYRHRLPGYQGSCREMSLSLSTTPERETAFYYCRVELPELFNDLTHTVHLIVRQDNCPSTPTVSHQRGAGKVCDLNTTTIIIIMKMINLCYTFRS
ncbi:hepatitis A virus cellular receptor 1 homolog [Salmo salar]|uniref:Hepatitis A virus cellular receptor 1 homolog n=1 Tax=Salmo salar TaxID=8030 RepID=A0ABM3EQK9_SALSA|nr:hepatitis A virus cellular receptor 1 homolog [Salmo salar]